MIDLNALLSHMMSLLRPEWEALPRPKTWDLPAS